MMISAMGIIIIFGLVYEYSILRVLYDYIKHKRRALSALFSVFLILPFFALYLFMSFVFVYGEDKFWIWGTVLFGILPLVLALLIFIYRLMYGKKKGDKSLRKIWPEKEKHGEKAFRIGALAACTGLLIVFLSLFLFLYGILIFWASLLIGAVIAYWGIRKEENVYGDRGKWPLFVLLSLIGYTAYSGLWPLILGFLPEYDTYLLSPFMYIYVCAFFAFVYEYSLFHLLNRDPELVKISMTYVIWFPLFLLFMDFAYFTYMFLEYLFFSFSFYLFESVLPFLIALWIFKSKK